MGALKNCMFKPIVPAREVPGAKFDGPLAGKRFVAKANIDAAGLRTGNGSPAWAMSHAPSKRSAPCLGALLRAGALLLGMTHMDELGFSIAGDNAHYGALDNPAAPGRAVGGSSSGSAFAVAAGEADLALGTDTCGSVRIPASHCGLFGLRPTHGRVSTEGVCELAPTLDVVGLLAADAHTTLLATRALLAPTELDARVPEPPPPPLYTTVLWAEDAMRLFSCAEQTDLSPEQRSAAEASFAAGARRLALRVAAGAEGGGRAPGGAAEAEREAAARVVDVDIGARLLDAVGDPLAELAPAGCGGEAGLRAAAALMRSIFAEEASERIGRWQAEYADVTGEMPALGPEVAERLSAAQGAPRLGAEGKRTRAALAEALNWLLASHEDGQGALALLCLPAAPSPAPLPAVAQDAAYRERCFALASLASLAGCPQLVVPLGRCEATGLPLAVSFIARPGRDDELVQAVARVCSSNEAVR